MSCERAKVGVLVGWIGGWIKSEVKKDKEAKE
jgi:hypothetical protein